MNSFTGKLLIGALVVATSALGATSANAAKGGIDRPMKATATGMNTIADFAAGECGFPIDLGDGRGPRLVCDQTIDLDFKGTHVGRSGYTSTGSITLFLAEGCLTSSSTLGVVFESSQTGTIVAANGDTLTAQLENRGCGDGITQAEPTGTFSIIGGTGRFEGATGSGTVNGVALGSSLSNEWAGTISY